MSDELGKDNVVFLKFRSPEIADDTITFHCCKHCRNKTFTLTETEPTAFPVLKCAACGHQCGYVGFTDNDGPKSGPKSA